jgi:hypothetical protein
VPAGATHPSTPCQLCQPLTVIANGSPWLPQPGVPCSDGNPCTYTVTQGPLYDVCNASGVCVGSTRYSCTVPSDRTCQQASVCTGFGLCEPRYNTSGVCRAAIDACDIAEVCAGAPGFCGPGSGTDTTNIPTLARGWFALDGLSSSDGVASISYVSQRSALRLRTQGFSVTCGPVLLSWAMLANSGDHAACNSATLQTLAGLPTYRDTIASALMQNYSAPLSTFNITENVFYSPAVVVQTLTSPKINSTPFTIASVNCTNLFMLDTTPPRCPGGLRTLGPQYCFNTANFSLFLDCNDSPGSGIANISIAVGSTVSGTNLMPWTQRSLDSLINLDLSPLVAASRIFFNSTFFVTARLVNGAGLSTVVGSRSLCLDITPPLAGVVTVGVVNFLNGRFTWSNFRDLESQIAQFEWRTCECDNSVPACSAQRPFVALNSTATTANVSFFPPLVPGQRYCTQIRASNGVGMQVTSTSPSFAVANTGPITTGTVGVVTTPGSELVPAPLFFTNTTATLNVAWQNFSDGTGEPMTSYEYAIGNSTHPQSEVTFTPLASFPPLAVTVPNLRLRDGLRYFVTVRGTSASGLQAQQTSNAVLVDMSPPVVGQLVEQPSLQFTDGDVAFQSINTSISLVWRNFADAESGIARFLTCVGTAAGACNTVDWTAVPPGDGTPTSAVISAPLVTNTTYFAALMVINRAGSSSFAVTNGVAVDTIAPRAVSSVRDGAVAGTDIDFQGSTTTMSAWWEPFASGPSSVAFYRYGIGNCQPNNLNILNWVQTTQTSFTRGNLTLASGQTYCVLVQATSGARVVSATIMSNGVRVVTQTPVAGTVRNGLTDTHQTFQSSRTLVSANWGNFSDRDSFIMTYLVGVGMSPGVDDVLPFTNVGNVTSVQNLAVALSNPRYFVVVRAVNAAGRFVTASSPFFMVQGTAPTAGVVSVRNANIGPGSIFFASSLTPTIVWTNFMEFVSFFVSFRVVIVPTNNASAVLVDQEVFDTSVAVPAGRLRPNITYTVFVSGCNAALLCSPNATTRLRVDTSPPLVARVLLGSSASPQLFFRLTDASTTVLWPGVQDFESDVASFTFGVGLTCAAADVIPFTVISATSTTLNLQALDKSFIYRAIVVATNRAGLSSTMCSGRFGFDATAPVFAVSSWRVRDASPGALVLPMTIPACFDDESGVAGQAYALSQLSAGDVSASTPSPSSFVPLFIDASAATVSSGNSSTAVSSGGAVTVFVPVSNFSLGAPVVAFARCTNAAGLTTFIRSAVFVANSGAPQVDVHLVVNGVAQSGMNLFTSSLNELRVTWDIQQSSDVASIVHGLGSAPGRDDVATFMDVSALSSRTLTALNLSSGVTYFHTVRASFPKFNNLTVNVSKPMTCDSSPPVVPSETIIDGDGQPGAAPDTRRTCRLSLLPTDAESGIVSVQWGIGTSTQRPDVFGWAPLNLSSVNVTTAFNTTVFVNRTGVNATRLGNTTTITVFNTTIVGPFLNGTCSTAACSNVIQGQRYFCLFLVTNGAGLARMAAGTGQVIDSTPPTYRTPAVVAYELLNSTTLQLTFPECRDDDSGVLGFAFRLVNGSASNFSTSSGLITTRTAVLSTRGFPRGLFFTAFVRCVNGAGLWAEVPSAPFVPNYGLPPVTFRAGRRPTSSTVGSTQTALAPAMSNQTNNNSAGENTNGVAVAFQTDANSVSAWWDIGQHAETLRLQFAVGTSALSDDVLSWRDVSAMTETTIAGLGLGLQTGQQYYQTLKVASPQHNLEQSFSAVFAVDPTPPFIGDVIEASGAGFVPDALLQCRLAAQPTDPDSGIARLRWGVSSNGLTADIISWRPLNATTLTGECANSSVCPDFVHGRAFWCLVEVTNGAGWAVVARGAGSVVDMTPPLFEDDVLAGPQLDAGGQTLRWAFPACRDPESGVTGFSYRVDMWNSTRASEFSPVVSSTNVSFSRLDFVAGVLYTATLRCHNGAGRARVLTTSTATVLVPLHVSVPVFCSTARGDPVNRTCFQTATDQASARWVLPSPTDALTLELGLGSTPDVANVAPFTAMVGLRTEFMLTGLSLAAGRPYFFLLRLNSTDGASLVYPSSFPLYVDATPPVLPAVTAGNGSAFQTALPRCNLSAMAVDTESGIASVTWGLGRSSLDPDVTGWRSLPSNATSAVCDAPECTSLLPGTPYWCVFQAANRAGARTIVHSNAVVLDTTPPVVSLLTRPCPDRSSCLFQPLNLVRVSWNPPSDPESGVTQVELCVGSTSADCSLLPWTRVGLNTTAYIVPNPANVTGSTAARLRVTNGAGLVSVSAPSTAQLVSSRPTPGTVFDLPCADKSVMDDVDQADVTCVAARWVGFGDAVAGLHEYQIGIGTAPGLDDILSFRSAGLETLVRIARTAAFPAGTRAFTTVVAVNGAGLSIASSSDGFVFTRGGEAEKIVLTD